MHRCAPGRYTTYEIINPLFADTDQYPCASHADCPQGKFCVANYNHCGMCDSCNDDDTYNKPISGSCDAVLNCKGGWDLKCKVMTKVQNGKDKNTCQTNSEADYESDCKKCAAGSYSDRSGSTSNNCCPLGHANKTKEDCIDSEEDQSDCADIEQYADQRFDGNYNDACAFGQVVGKSAHRCCICKSWTCQACQAGKYQNSTGASTCLVCPYKDQTSDAGSKTAADCYVSCPPGKYAFNTTLCLTCPVNMGTDADTLSIASTTASNDRLGDCKCKPGYYAIDPDNPTNKTCDRCPKDTYKTSTSDESSCTACPVNTGDGMTQCKSCLLCCAMRSVV